MHPVVKGVPQNHATHGSVSSSPRKTASAHDADVAPRAQPTPHERLQGLKERYQNDWGLQKDPTSRWSQFKAWLGHGKWKDIIHPFHAGEKIVLEHRAKFATEAINALADVEKSAAPAFDRQLLHQVEADLKELTGKSDIVEDPMKKIRGLLDAADVRASKQREEQQAVDRASRDAGYLVNIRQNRSFGRRDPGWVERNRTTFGELIRIRANIDSYPRELQDQIKRDYKEIFSKLVLSAVDGGSLFVLSRGEEALRRGDSDPMQRPLLDSLVALNHAPSMRVEMEIENAFGKAHDSADLSNAIAATKRLLENEQREDIRAALTQALKTLEAGARDLESNVIRDPQVFVGNLRAQVVGAFEQARQQDLLDLHFAALDKA